MALDAGIYGLMGHGVKTIDEYDQLAQQREANKLALLMHQMQYGQAQQGMADDNALREATRQFGVDPMANRSLIAGTGNYKALQAYDKAQQDAQHVSAQTAELASKTKGQDLEQSIKAHDFHVQQLGAINDPALVPQWLEQGVKNGVLTREQAAAGMQRVSQALQQPGGFEAWKRSAMQGGQSASEQLKQAQALQVAQMQDATSRSNNANTVAETARGHDLANARSREGNEIQRQAARTQVVDTDSGPVLVDKGSAEVRQLLGADGQQLSKPLKPIPAQVNTAIVANSQNLNKIDTALKLLEGQSVGEMKGDKSATGVKGYLPNGLLNRVDPSGTETRAQIADIGSLVLHDRSGAAVTASESPRLMPFIPLATDDAVTAAKKLKRFKQIYEQENQALSQTYSKDQGYKPSPLLNSESAPPAPANMTDAVAAEMKRRGLSK